MKKIISLVLIMFIVLGNFSKTNFIYAEDDEYKSDYDKCIEDKDVEACMAAAKETRGSNYNDLVNRISEAESSLEAKMALVEQYSQQAESLQGEIDNLKVQIDDLKARIEQLEIQIAENEAKVSALNERAKKRMVDAQMTMHFNGYLEFILGSKSFTDMLSRIYGVEAIVSKDKSDRESLLNVIDQLTRDKEELDAAKVKLDEDYDAIVAKQAEYLLMEQMAREEEERIEAELEDLTAERDRYDEFFSDLAPILKELGVTVNDGFVAAVHNSWISGGVWNYGDGFLGGTWHLGVDYAASRGTAIHAPAGGIVIRADGSCGQNGSLYNYCGEWIAGGGNQVYLMCEVDGSVYGFIFFHMQDVYVGYGDYVLQDETIGTVGSSGKSTGPHCHIEMYYLGKGELIDYVTMGWNVTFSVGRGATAYGNRCEVSGPPCILDPELYLPG